MSRTTACLLLIALLGACASTPTPDSDWNLHREQLAALESWTFNGRIAVRTTEGGDTASLRWQQQRDDISMTLAGPMGMKQTTLLREGGRLSLQQGDQTLPLLPGDDPLQREFGWSLPLDYLPWWLRGLPAPGPSREALANGRLSSLEQAGWRLDYADYQAVDGIQLPRIIRFERDEVSGKILLKNWSLAP